MRTTVAAFTVALLIAVLPVPAVGATPIQVDVRIEGKTETLFEGPVLTVPHRVKAASDQHWRLCNGVNLNVPSNLAPAPVPTSVSSDAMRILGETFDGHWYNQYEDYFVTRWGPDEQNVGDGEYWGIVVNDVFTDVGGCQYQLDGGDEVLWVYGAFGGKPRLGLFPADYSGGETPLTATAALGEPFEVEVDAWSGYNEGVPPPSPQRSGSSPFQGAVLAPVETDPEGFERIETDSSETVLTAADGRASVVFDDPGWHRIKATAVDPLGVETVIRSNRLDVCVPAAPASDCGAPPAEDAARVPPPPAAGEEEGQSGDPQPGGSGHPPADSGGGAAGSSSPGQDAGSPALLGGQVRLQLPRLDRSRIARGLVTVSWRVLDAGVGIGKWTIASKTLDRKGARYVNRAGGRTGTSATLRLPRGAGYRLRLTVVDVLGRSSTASIGKVEVPA